MKPHESKSLLILGIHQATEAYPNTLYRVRALRERYGACEISEPLWSNPTGGWKSASHPLRTIRQFLSSHLRIIFALIRGPRCEVVYIPYPAPSVVLLLSFVPKCKRPHRIIVDGFISLYDTVVNDRRIWKSQALQSKMLRALERRAFLKADLVVVDTPQNGEFYADLFTLARGRFLSLPLATNEVDYNYHPYRPVVGKCRVLFIGTLVPLHGISTIIEAARILIDRKDIEFRILGDGSDGPTLQSGMAGLSNVSWHRRWHAVPELARNIRESDICLGVFGNTAKVQRVCPYKLYLYASVGRATITGDTEWLRSTSITSGEVPFHSTPVADPERLAGAIRYLADYPEARSGLAEKARRFYVRHLTNEASLQLLANSLFGLDLKGSG